MINNIILIGMPASGKTTIGRLLSEALPNYTYIDTDSFIEKTSGMKISEILSTIYSVLVYCKFDFFRNDVYKNLMEH